MLSNIVQYWLQGSIEVLLKLGKKIVLNKGLYMDKELNSLIGKKIRVQNDRFLRRHFKDQQVGESHEDGH